jgi:hypothetical protein
MVLPEIQTQNYRFIGDFNLDKYAFSSPMSIKNKGQEFLAFVTFSESHKSYFPCR